MSNSEDDGHYDLGSHADAPRLTKLEEAELCALKALGDAAARDILTTRNLAIALNAAHRTDRQNGGHLCLDDLFGEAMILLLRAVDLFDAQRGRLSTIAVPLIVRGLALYVNRYERGPVCLPEDAARLLPLLRRDMRILEAELDRLPTPDELAKRTGLPVAEVSALIDATARGAVQFGEAESMGLISDMAQHFEPESDGLPEDRGDLVQALRGANVSRRIAELYLRADVTPRQAMHVGLRYDLFGLTGYLTLREIGELTGFSPATVSSDIRKAETKLAALVSGNEAQ